MLLSRIATCILFSGLVVWGANSASGMGLEEVNFWRARNGLRPLREDPLLTRFAQRDRKSVV